MPLFTMVPERLIGDDLIPLNEIRKIDSALYDEYAKNYNKRPWLMEQRIPPLDCKWGDVVFLTSVHPASIARGIREAGHAPRSRKFFVVAAEAIDPSSAVLWLGNNPDDPRDYRPYRSWETYFFTVLPQKAIDRYKEVKETGERLLFFAYLPHILVRGPVRVKGAEVIEM